MKKLFKTTTFILATFSVVTTIHAATPGFYVGGGLGATSLADFSDANKTSSSYGLGGQVFAGFNFSPFFGVEAGYDKFANTTYNISGYENLTFDYEFYTMNLVVKGYLPLATINPAIDLYILGGVAEANGSVSDVEYYGESIAYKPTSTDAMVAKLGVGLQYNITPHVSTSLEYAMTGAKSGDEESIGIPQSSMLSLNVAYHLGMQS